MGEIIMNIRCRQICGKGALHERMQCGIQDQIRTFENERYAAVIVADGVSEAKNGAQGAELACCAVEDYIGHEGENVFAFSKQKLAYLMTEHILYQIEKAAEREQCELTDYASTIMFVCADKLTGFAVCFNLGDGRVLMADNRGESLTELRSYRSEAGCCQTTTQEAYRFVKAGRLELRAGESLMLCTDGFAEALRDENIQKALKSYINNENDNGLKEMLREKQLCDDYTCAILMRQIPEGAGT